METTGTCSQAEGREWCRTWSPQMHGSLGEDEETEWDELKKSRKTREKALKADRENAVKEK